MLETRTENQRLLIKRIITNNELLKGEDCHQRWSKLYEKDANRIMNKRF